MIINPANIQSLEFGKVCLACLNKYGKLASKTNKLIASEDDPMLNKVTPLGFVYFPRSGDLLIKPAKIEP